MSTTRRPSTSPTTGSPAWSPSSPAATQVHVEALGSLTIGGPPVARDSIYRIASTTKPITAAATLALVAEGLLGLDEPVDRLLPELADRQVLRRMDGPLDDTVPAASADHDARPADLHVRLRAGLRHVHGAEPWPVVTRADELRPAHVRPARPGRDAGPDDVDRRPRVAAALTQPGERWLYNTGGSVLGVLVARAAGSPFGEVLRSPVFEPLGMSDTGFFTTETDRLATAYRPARTARPGAVRRPDGAWSRPPAFEDGSGGLVSTVDDLLAFARMLLRGGDPVLPADLAAAMCTDQLTDAQKVETRRLDLSGRPVLGLRPGRAYHSGAFGWDGGLGSILAGRPGPRPDRHRADPARVRLTRPADGARRRPGRGLRRARLNSRNPPELAGHVALRRPRSALAPHGQLLDGPGVAVGVAEPGEPAPGQVLHWTGLDAARDQVRIDRVGVVDHDLQPLDRAGRRVSQTEAERDRRGRAGRRQLDEPDLIADRDVVVGDETDLVDVERLGRVDVGDGEDHQLEPDVERCGGRGWCS